ncbi:MAG: hypothetical protein H6Q73_1270 [Firmicutes bacterium]|nr:hypothetical protein [Bacillota bacterium]
MRKIVFIVWWFIFTFVSFMTIAPPLANAHQYGAKAVVAVLPAINNSGLRGGQYTAEMVNEALAAKFPADRYIVLSGQNLLDKLRMEGVEDYSTADSSALLAAFRAMMVDYSVRAEVLFVVTEQQLDFPNALILLKRWTATVPLYMIVADVNNGTNLYDSVITESGEHQALVGFVKQSNAVRRALEKDLQRFGREFWLPE